MQPSPHVPAIETIIAAHRRLGSFEARIDRPTPGRGATPPPILVARQGDVVTLRTNDGRDPLSGVRTYRVTGARGTMYDDLLHERLTTTLRGPTPYLRLASLLGYQEVATALILDPNSLQTFLTELAVKRGWKVSRGNLLLQSGNERTRILFDPVKGLVTSISRRQGKSGFDIRYRYAANGLRAWALPPTARAVGRLSTFEGLRFAEPKARAVVRRMVARHARMTSGVIRETADGGATYEILFGNGRIRQRGARLDVLYGGKRLTVLNRRTRQVYGGVAGTNDARRVAARLGEPLIPISMALLVRRIPFASLLAGEQTARLNGRIILPSGPADILDLSRGGAKMTIFVSRDGLIRSLQTEQRDNAGVRVSGRKLKLSYGKPSAGAFTAPAGGKILPLPKK